MFKLLPVISLAAVLLVAGAGAAVAQDRAAPRERAERAERPYRGLFGTTERKSGERHALELRASLDESYDQNVLGEPAGGTQARRSPGDTDGFFSSLNMDVEYRRTGDRLTLEAHGGSAARYYPDFDDFVGLTHRAGAAMAAQLGRTRVAVAQDVEYAPYYRFQFIPSLSVTSALDPLGAEGDLLIDPRPAYRYVTETAIEQAVGRRGSAAASYGLGRTDFTDATEVDLVRQRAGVRYRQAISRGAGLRLEYQLDEGNYGATQLRPGRRARTHALNIGVDYRRRLAFSRWANFSLKLGSSTTDLADAGGRINRATAEASIVHELGRTWNLRGEYRRGADVIEGLAEPVFADAVNVALGGFVTRRLDLIFSGAYSEGTIGPTGARNDYDTRNGSARARFALGRRLALFGEYFYYHYEFGQGAPLPVGLPRTLDRHGARAGLMLHVPVF